MNTGNVIPIGRNVNNQDFDDAQVRLQRTRINFESLPALTTEENETINRLLDGCGIPYARLKLQKVFVLEMFDKIQADL